MSLARELETYLHLHIPISASMGVSVLEASYERVRLRLPLEPNINHRQSVFGGSESSAAILSAWSLLWVRLQNCDPIPRLVINSNTMDYTRPIDTHFDAITMPVDPDTWRRFLSGLERRGKSRIHIRAVLQTGDQICGEFSGAFVALSS